MALGWLGVVAAVVAALWIYGLQQLNVGGPGAGDAALVAGGVILLLYVVGFAMYSVRRRRREKAAAVPPPASPPSQPEPDQRYSYVLSTDVPFERLYNVRLSGDAVLATTVHGVGGGIGKPRFGESHWIETATYGWLDRAAEALRDDNLPAAARPGAWELERILAKASTPPPGFKSTLGPIRDDAEWRVLEMIRLLDAALALRPPPFPAAPAPTETDPCPDPSGSPAP